MAERDSLEVDVLFVGGGPASLAGAIRLRQLAASAGADISVMVIEKGGEIGNHGFSGAVVDPKALHELFPDDEITGGLDAPVSSDAMWLLTKSGKIPAPLTPPVLNNHGKYVASLSTLTKWLGAKAEAAGADVFPAFPGQELLWDQQRVVGVRVGDKGVAHDGTPKSNYEPGPDLLAKVVVLGEGPRGTLTKTAIARLGLDEGRDPQVYAVGIKELWRVPGRLAPGTVIHTLGAPLPADTFGGGWIYAMNGDIIDIGLVTGLDYADPSTDPHDLFRRLKLHPAIRPLLEGGEMIKYGAKAIPEGGLHAMPRFYADGLCIVGDSAGFLNGLRLKGIHLAMKSGMMAAEAIFEGLQAGDTSARKLQGYEDRFRDSWAFSELHAARNFHAGFSSGIIGGLINASLGILTGGRGFGIHDKLSGHAGHSRMRKLGEREQIQKTRRVVPDGKLTFDKLTDVYKSGTMHDEDQVPHLHVADTNICADRCTVEYGNPCQYFCPANVYEPRFSKRGDAPADGKLQINFANCVHCKTCDIMDPYQIITWVPPQGGEGPVYTGM
ncbi:MAG TPA: electron transfer flavoprotein-ubiquinone oxidoreductase [Candidatus Acidoferrum sp.]|nr:electron transfer flavoprotein-ubiquinone oxidoreductase [Candidatus Acidoferrum sp.]